MKEMVKISKDFVEKNVVHVKGILHFGYNITKDGIAFCDKNSIKEFPDLFKGNLEYVNISHEDVFAENGDQWLDPKNFGNIKSLIKNKINL